VAWCREHEATIGIAIGAHVARPRHELLTHELAAVVAPSSSEIRPLEKFVVPAKLDGSRGLYRRPQEQCLLRATNDHQAILAWLQSKHGLTPEQKKAMAGRRRQRGTGVEAGLDWLPSLSNTQRAYRKEAERFLLWAIVQRGKALSSMTNEDCAAYRNFIADPSRAAVDLVRNAEPRTLVAALAAVRGGAVGGGAAAHGNDSEKPVRVPGRPELPDGQPVVGCGDAPQFGPESQCGAEFERRSMGVRVRAAGRIAGDFG
jgi:hypothetical protein